MARNDEVHVNITGDASNLDGALRRANAAIDRASKQWKKDFGALEQVAKKASLAIAGISAVGGAVAFKALKEAAKDSKELSDRLDAVSKSWHNVFAAIGRTIAGDDPSKTIGSLADAIQRVADSITRNERKFAWFFTGLRDLPGLIGAAATGGGAGLASRLTALRGVGIDPRAGIPHLPDLVVDVSDQVRTAQEQRKRAAAEAANERAKAAVLRAEQNQFAFRHWGNMMMPLPGATIPFQILPTRYDPSVSDVGGFHTIGARASAISSRRALPTGSNSLIDRLGGREAALLLALQGAQGAAGGDPLGALLNTASSAGFAIGGPAGLGIAAGTSIIGALSKIFGSSRDREDEAYRAHARALREARDNTPTVVLNFPAGALYNTSDPDFQEAIMETIESATGNRVGRVTFARG